MRIVRTTQPNLFHKPATASLTQVAEKDKALSEGILDTFESQAERVDEAASSVRNRFLLNTVPYSLFGGVIGGTTGVLGAAVGVGVGAYIAYNKTIRRENGKVTINHNGEKRVTDYKESTKNYVKTASEVRAEMMSRGTLGEMIEPPPELRDLPIIKPNPKLDAHNEDLKALAEAKKLLADFGKKSRYGHPVLHSVDAKSARALLGAGEDVYVVSGKSKDQVHNLSVTAHNEHKSVMRVKEYGYVERAYDYELTNLSKDGAFANLPEGDGLPEAFFGVYRDNTSTTLNIGQARQHGFSASNNNSDYSEFDYDKVTRADNVGFKEQNAKVFTVHAPNYRDVVTMAGVAGGMMAGMALVPGAAQAGVAIGGALGGVVGRELGNLVQSRAFKKAKADQIERQKAKEAYMNNFMSF